MRLLSHRPAPGRVACLSQTGVLKDSAETSLHTACRNLAGILGGHTVLWQKTASDLKKTEKF